MKKTIFLAGYIIFTFMINNAFSQQQPPLIDREVFFGDPQISAARLSPDGQFMSFLRPFEGTRNIWVKTREAAFEDAIAVTAVTQRPIMSYFWSRDSRFLLYVMDRGGDENFNIYALDPSQAAKGQIPEARNITNLEGVQATIYHVSRIDPDLLFVGLNHRDPAWHDLYSLNISSGELTLLRENTNRYTSWIFDFEDNLRIATRALADGTNELWRMDSGAGQTLLISWGVLDTAYPSGFKEDNRNLYFVSNAVDNSNLTQLYILDIETGKLEFEEKDPENKADFGGMARSEETLEILFTFYTDEYTRRYFRNQEFRKHFDDVKEKAQGAEVSFYSPTLDERYWMINMWSDTDPGTVHIYDTQTRKLDFQYRARPELPSGQLSPMRSIWYASSDGLMIQAYLTLPRGFGQSNLPLVVIPHGGPWARDRWGYDGFVQFLANRGYAVLQPNFRGSTGFGRDFLDAGNQQWGQLMQDDITWGVKYLVDQGIADAQRVGIFGGSYGGYAALAGVTFTPDLYAAAISFVGPSNLKTLLNSIPPYWESFRIVLHTRMADPSTSQGQQLLLNQSPLFHADKITTPLMIVQGKNDPRVLEAESDQIVVALRERGFPVVYLNAPDEGHGFARPVNNMAFVAAMEKFFAKYLGGRYQETMTPEVSKRLEEITVDINTVKVN
jgi:dipeptidyl aminopeptidase/acylaminoacyl peptidase